MLLESRINDRSTLTIDAESVGGIDKGGTSVQSHPDKLLPNLLVAIQGVAENIGEAFDVDTAYPPAEMEVSFTLRMDSNSIVSVARSAEAGQFKVTLRWKRD